jgi:hypothetical protein
LFVVGLVLIAVATGRAVLRQPGSLLRLRGEYRRIPGRIGDQRIAVCGLYLNWAGVLTVNHMLRRSRSRRR